MLVSFIIQPLSPCSLGLCTSSHGSRHKGSTTWTSLSKAESSDCQEQKPILNPCYRTIPQGTGGMPIILDLFHHNGAEICSHWNRYFFLLSLCKMVLPATPSVDLWNVLIPWLIIMISYTDCFSPRISFENKRNCLRLLYFTNIITYPIIWEHLIW